jgi:hypothetical protein
VRFPSDITDRLCSAAQRARVNVAIGVIERANEDESTGWHNHTLLIDAEGQLVDIARRSCTPLRGASGFQLHAYARHTAPARVGVM